MSEYAYYTSVKKKVKISTQSKLRISTHKVEWVAAVTLTPIYLFPTVADSSITPQQSSILQVNSWGLCSASPVHVLGKTSEQNAHKMVWLA